MNVLAKMQYSGGNTYLRIYSATNNRFISR